MKLCLVHNEYGKFSGEEAVVARQRNLLQAHGHTVDTFTRTSADITDTITGKASAFFTGIYNPASRKAFRTALEESKPDLVHIHNLFPLISPSVLPECRKAGVPVAMTLHNFRLLCPNALLFAHGDICRQCLAPSQCHTNTANGSATPFGCAQRSHHGVGGREWRCVFRNCEGSIAKSLGYALRTAISRRFRWFLDNVNVFACLTEFQRQIYISQGFPPDRCIVIPNFISVPHPSALDAPTLPHSASSARDTFASATSDEQRTTNDAYVLYVGRVSPEKDVPILLDAARLLTDVPFRIAGSYWRMPGLPQQAPANVTFLGELPPSSLPDLYEQSSMIVFATRCYEGFPTVLLEAMAHAKPVVCTDIGGLAEIVEDHITGLLYRTGNARLADMISELWNDPALCRSLGEAGRRKVEREYGPDKAYDRLMAAYEMARECNRAE